MKQNKITQRELKPTRNQFKSTIKNWPKKKKKS